MASEGTSQETPRTWASRSCGDPAPGISFSFVVPVYNERDNLVPLWEEMDRVAERLGAPCEFIFADDGSTDGSDRVLADLARRDRRVVVVTLRRNYGQTAAMQAGIDHARGMWIVMLDADLQNDPADIPRMVEVAERGYDVVCGWRRNRQDKFWSRRLPSRLANRLIAWVTQVPVHDLGCTLRVIHGEIARELDMQGELHRFIPILAHWRGARICEVDVHHRPRRFGTSKYGLSRTVRVLLDLIAVHFLLRYSTRPIHWFGLWGLGAAMAAGASLAGAIGMKLAWHTDMTGNPLLLLSVLMTMLAVQFVSLGILGETLARVFFDARGLRPYAVRRVQRHGESEAAAEGDSRRGTVRAA